MSLVFFDGESSVIEHAFRLFFPAKQIPLNHVVFLLLPLISLVKKITQSTFLSPLVFVFWVTFFCSTASPSSISVSDVSVTFD